MDLDEQRKIAKIQKSPKKVVIMARMLDDKMQDWIAGWVKTSELIKLRLKFQKIDEKRQFKNYVALYAKAFGSIKKLDRNNKIQTEPIKH